MALPGELLQIPTLSKQQQGLQNQSISQAMSMLGGGNKQFDFAPIEQQELRRFHTQTVPGINQLFTNIGAGGGRSSAQLPALSSAGADLSERLAALKGQYGLQQQGLNQQLLGMLLQNSNQPGFQNIYKPREAGVSEQLLPYLPELLKAYQLYTSGTEGAAGATGGEEEEGSDSTKALSALSSLFQSNPTASESNAGVGRSTNATLSERLNAAFKGGLGGAIAGGTAGSIFPVVGTTIGGVGGSLLGALLAFLAARPGGAGGNSQMALPKPKGV